MHPPIARATWGLLAMLALPLHAQALPLSQAMKLAAERHPQAEMATLSAEAAGGLAIERTAYGYNPELTVEQQDRRRADRGRSQDWYLYVSQGIEMGGKSGHRMAAANDNLKAEQALLAATRQTLMLNAASAYVALAYARRELDLRRQLRDIYATLAAGLSRQVELGQASKLSFNLIRGAYAAALTAAVAAEQTVLQYRRDFATALGGMEETPEEIPPLPPAWQQPPESENSIWDHRPDLQLLDLRQRQAEALAALADSGRLPDPTLSAMVGREAGDRIFKIGLTLPLPVLNTHRGAYLAARAEGERSRVEAQWARQRLHFELRSALERERVAVRAAAELATSSLLDDIGETIDLVRRGYLSGELDLSEMVLLIQQGIDGRLAAMETLRLAWMARIDLARVLGRPDLVATGVLP